MTANSISQTFREVTRSLHRQKSAAYRNAWKRRGEQISIIANIARKVDRLEFVIDGAPVTQDESIIDTVIDLYVYVLKYETYLADQDETLAEVMFPGTQAQPPYSDGVDGFEFLLAQADLTALDEGVEQGLTECVQDVLLAFAQVEVGVTEPIAAVADRARRARALAVATINLVALLHQVAPERYDEFLRQHA